MTTQALRALSLHQTGRLIDGLTRHFELLSPAALEERAGFVAVRSARAQQWVKALRARGVFVDARGSSLRFGPAPYLSDQSLSTALEIVAELAKTLS